MIAAARPGLPVIVISAQNTIMTAIQAAEADAYDYLPKPFDPRELVARINTIVKRKQADVEETDSLEYGDLVIDKARREVRVKKNAISLTTMEYRLLLLLCESPGKDFSRDDILNALKGTETELFTRSVDILVSRLRNKLKPVEPIKTVYGSGYAFVGPSQDNSS